MNALQKRQTVIIQQLKELKGKLSTMHKTLLADVSTTKKPTNGDLKTSQRSGDLKPINVSSFNLKIKMKMKIIWQIIPNYS